MNQAKAFARMAANHPFIIAFVTEAVLSPVEGVAFQSHGFSLIGERIETAKELW
jgi:hypothetical protein